MKSSVQDAVKLILAAACVLAAACNGEGLRTEYTYLKALDEDEDVFAYGRIAPDGRRFVYTSERVSAESSSGYVRAVVVYDVDEQRVAFTEPGIDGYWSPDGARMIYLSQRGEPAVSVLDVRTMTVRRGIAPVALGDYYSWGVDIDDHDVILTITGHYYYLKAGQAELPPRRVIECSPVGPLVARYCRRMHGS